jgi:ComF family protein
MKPFEFIKFASQIALDQLIPPTCLSCGDITSSSAGLCNACWPTISFISSPLCSSCGKPFDLENDIEISSGTLCAACIKQPPSFSIMRSALLYDDSSKAMILGFKHSNRLEAAPLFTKWLCGADSEIFNGAELITAVPLHWRRLFKRKYNQSAILANAVGKKRLIRSIPDLLQRHRHTETQGQLSRLQRRANVRGAFKLNNRYRIEVQNNVIILVDDVVTSGATIDACTRVLLNAGAAEVRVLTLARPQSLAITT